jgi:hypothetical protein
MKYNQKFASIVCAILLISEGVSTILLPQETQIDIILYYISFAYCSIIGTFFIMMLLGGILKTHFFNHSETIARIYLSSCLTSTIILFVFAQIYKAFLFHSILMLVSNLFFVYVLWNETKYRFDIKQ